MSRRSNQHHATLQNLMYEVSPGTLLVGPGSTGEEGFKLFEIPPEELSTARLLSGNPAPDFDMFSHGAGRHDLAGGRLFGKLAVPRQRCAKPLSDSAGPLCARQTDLDHRDGPDCVQRRPVVCFVSRYFPVSGPTGPLCKKRCVDCLPQLTLAGPSRQSLGFQGPHFITR